MTLMVEAGRLQCDGCARHIYWFHQIPEVMHRVAAARYGWHFGPEGDYCAECVAVRSANGVDDSAGAVGGDPDGRDADIGLGDGGDDGAHSVPESSDPGIDVPAWALTGILDRLDMFEKGSATHDLPLSSVPKFGPSASETSVEEAPDRPGPVFPSLLGQAVGEAVTA